jgi:pyruvate,water dikinase
MSYTRTFDEIGRDDVALAGGKGANLGELSRAGLPVPAGFVLTTAAYDAFVESNDIGSAIVGLASVPRSNDPAAFEEVSGRIHALFSGGRVPEEVVSAIRVAYGRMARNGERAVAVRSSATAEDLAGASFAGQQETYLNVRGQEALLEAIRRCWASLWTARAMAYRARQGIAAATLSLAVVVQEMVEAEAAGVMFTANPANGRRDEAVIGAAWGLGESVVSGSVTPDDIVVRKGTGRVVSRETADQEVMSVYSEHGTEDRPVPEARRRQQVLDDETAAELARYGARIEAHYGAPQDIEWALSGGEVFVVQARAITALPEPAADPPTEWPIPYPHGLYFRASIVEQMPDPLSPLFADLIDGSVTRSLSALMAQVFGSEILRDGDIGLPTVNGYAYYYYRTGAFWRLTSNLPIAVRAFAAGRLPAGPKGWREHSHPRYAALVDAWDAKSVVELASEDLLDGVGELLDAGTVYYTAVQSIIPLAASSELLFGAFYDRLVRRAGDPPAHTFLLGFDSEPIRAEKSLWDQAMWAREHPDLAAALSRGAVDTPAQVDPPRWEQWRSRFASHLDSYGHAVYNLDFLNPVPADDPSHLLDTVRFYLRGQGTDPHERQRRSADRRDEQARAVRARLDPARRAVFDRLLRWAQHTAPVREDALADMGLAWPAMRRMLLELGRRLADAGTIAEPADVFWLRHDELRGAIAVGGAGGIPQPRPALAAAVEERKMLWRGRRRAAAPQILPEGGWAVRLFAGMMPAASRQQPGNTIAGVGASSGRVTAPARVLQGPEDFGQMQPGDVLVARITTPAWTSLFAMASAVVTDVGGPLSHSSIVAREYGIPAVLGTGAATGRIRSGQSIQVDGDAGTVTLGDGADEGAAAADAPGRRRTRSVALALAAGAVVGLLARRRRRRR